ncbi:MAG: hypothetical protein HN341_16300, partial [Verrucomicrobia bacterium]|nr:hypothetical protein [Verrucomicrobiota bacterium]
MRTILTIIMFSVACIAAGDTVFETQSLSMSLKNGRITHMRAASSGTDYIAKGQPAPLLQVSVSGKLYSPDGMSREETASRLTLQYGAVGVKTVLAVKVRDTHIAFEVVAVEPKEKVELVLWGPYPTTINRTIGEMVGVVRDQEFGIGIQVLNPKTMGGYPTHPNDPLPIRKNVEDENYYDDIAGPVFIPGRRQRFWNNTADRTDFGSVLQAYCRDRSRELETSWGGYNPYTTPAINDGGTVGSAIALFGCPTPEILSALEAIELAEDLPHVTTADGQWTKAIKAGPSALLIDFTEANFEEALALTKRAGVDILYSRFVFQTWGSFKLRPDKFPNGRE